MAVKVFCNACQTFIKNADRNDLRVLTGEEICETCHAGVDNAFDEVHKIAQRGIVQMERVRDDIKAEMDRLRKKVIQGEQA